VAQDAIPRQRRWLTGLVLAMAPAVAGNSLAATGMLDDSGRYAIQRWGFDDGLTDEVLTSVAAAADGSLVVAARQMLWRFDGVRFRPLPAGLVAAVHGRIGNFWNIGCDGRGRLWVQGGMAIARLDDDSAAGLDGWKVFDVPEGTLTSLAFTAAGQPLVVGPGTVFVCDGTRLRPLTVTGAAPADWRYGGFDRAGGQVWLWGGEADSRTLCHGPLPASPDGPLAVEPAEATVAGRVISVGFATAGPVALLRDAALAYRDGRWERASPDLPGSEHRTSGKIAVAADGTIWISSHAGILACREGRLDQPTARLPAVSFFTRGLITDSAGGVWAACNGGLVAIRPTRLVGERLGECRGVLARADGTLVVGTTGALLELPAAGPEGRGPRPLTALPEGAVPSALAEDAGGRIWIGTRDHFLLRWDGRRLEQITGPDAFERELRSIQALAVDADDRIWATTSNGLAVQEPDGDAFSFVPNHSGRDTATAIGLAAAEGGGVLVATAARGVSHVAADGTARRLLPAADLPGRRGLVLHRDSEGSLWVGGEQGLVRRAADGTVRRFSSQTGLVEDSVVQITEDAEGRLWVATRGGHIQGLTLTACGSGSGIQRGIVFGPLDGIGDDECVGGFAAGCGRAPGEVVVPLAHGLVRFDPSALPAQPPPRPASIRRGAGPGVAFTFAVPGLTWGEPPLFQTMLAGVDRDWSPPSAEARREYSAVPTGSYEFRVRLVAGETDRDFPVARLSVAVPAPWWRSPVAVLGLAGLAAGAGWGISRGLARRRIADLERQRELDRERARIARDIHDSLGAGLTRVALLSDLARRSDRPGDVRERLDAIHRDARDLTRSVDEIVWAVNPGNDTAGRFVSYVVHDVEQFARAGDLSLRLDVPDRLAEDPPLPAGGRHHVCLAIRELLQNVLRHARASHLDFGIIVDPETLLVTVADDGIGCSCAGEQEIGQDGLANVRSRVAEIGGELIIETSARTGTQVRIRVPLEPRRSAVIRSVSHAG